MNKKNLAEFTTNQLKKLHVVAFDTELMLTPKVLSLRNTEYNFESELVFGRSALVHFEPSNDLMVHFMGIHNGKMILNVQVYGFITFESQLEDKNLRSELNVHDYSVNSLINMNEAYMTVTGNDRKFLIYWFFLKKIFIINSNIFISWNHRLRLKRFFQSRCHKTGKLDRVDRIQKREDDDSIR